MPSEVHLPPAPHTPGTLTLCWREHTKAPRPLILTRGKADRTVFRPGGGWTVQQSAAAYWEDTRRTHFAGGGSGAHPIQEMEHLIAKFSCKLVWCTWSIFQDHPTCLPWSAFHLLVWKRQKEETSSSRADAQCSAGHPAISQAFPSPLPSSLVS